MTPSIKDRAIGALTGLALGDALGMPTQSMSNSDIIKAYGAIHGLNKAVPYQPIAPSTPAGSITDDTEQAILISQLIITGKGHIDPLSLATTLLKWEDDMRAKGSLDLLGPSTKLALEQVRNGEDITKTGKTGTTNGAAMRVTPVGIANSLKNLEQFADRVYESCRVTHDTTNGFCSAALIATAVSYGIEGGAVRNNLSESLETVDSFPERGAWTPKANVLARTKVALTHAAKDSDSAFFDFLHNECGTSVEANESIPAAFALTWRYADEPATALYTAAGLGGDTDTIAAMSGAMLGSCLGDQAFPKDSVQTVKEVSQLNFEPLAIALLKLRK